MRYDSCDHEGGGGGGGGGGMILAWHVTRAKVLKSSVCIWVATT